MIGYSILLAFSNFPTYTNLLTYSNHFKQLCIQKGSSFCYTKPASQLIFNFQFTLYIQDAPYDTQIR